MRYSVIKSYLLFIGACIIFGSCGSLKETNVGDGYQYDENGVPYAPGKCFAKVLIQDQYETYEKEILRYTGEDKAVEGVEFQKIVFRPAEKKWTKKKRENCENPNPANCLVWCELDLPEVAESYYIVTDTTKVKSYFREKVEVKRLVVQGGYTDWREVICETDMTPRYMELVQLALVREGYGDDVIPNGRTDSKTKAALRRFQMDNGLPLGGLDAETIAMLGLEIPE